MAQFPPTSTCRRLTERPASSSRARRRVTAAVVGGLGRRRQRRRLRRRDRRRDLCRPERQPVRRGLRGVRPGLGLCRQHRSLEPRRQHRLQAQRRGGGRLQRLVGGLGRRRQRRRLRRPDRRRSRCRPERRHMPAPATSCSAQASGFAANARSRRASTAATASGSTARAATTAAVGGLSRRRQWRRLRRPDHRRHRRRRRCTNAGASYVVFGKASGFAATSICRRLDGSDRLQAQRRRRRPTPAAISVASAGDVNGDGFDDLIVGAYCGRSARLPLPGRATWCSAKTRALPPISISPPSTAPMASSSAARRQACEDFSGRSVASAGDVNGDGFADLIVGALWADPHGQASGSSYVVFGKASRLCRQRSTSPLARLAPPASGSAAKPLLLPRLVFCIRRRCQWRRLRRPDRRLSL